MPGCCTVLRPDDGVIDNVAVDRAMQGQRVQLSKRERAWLILRLSRERGWGLDRISQHIGYSRTEVAVLLASARGR
ncbi:hypothetical protein [uncultured Jatrophihabitans sp.]|uniref:hypothetical protein n=1 Tax=uncultured Jatrophihabitans sp. TaxID=1610747 RepID=UPI0035CBB9E7